MRIIAGPPVKGDDFMFRNRELVLAKRSLLDGTSLLVKGWRRIGKSSLLVETHRQLSGERGATPLYLDVQELTTISEFFTAFLNALPQNKLQRLRALWDGARRMPGRLMDWHSTRMPTCSSPVFRPENGVRS